MMPLMLASGTAQALMGPDAQGLLDRAMKTAHIEEGVGDYTGEDVRSHLQEVALRYAQRFDPDRGVKLTTFLWQRVHGAAIQLVRSKGQRTRLGAQRPAVVSLEGKERRMEEELGWGEPELKDTLAGDGLLERSENQADMVLAVGRLPARMRMVLYLLYYDQLEPEIAARRMRCSADCIRGLRDAAFLKLRLALLAGP